MLQVLHDVLSEGLSHTVDTHHSRLVGRVVARCRPGPSHDDGLPLRRHLPEYRVCTSMTETVRQELHGTIDVTLEPRLVASRFMPAFTIGRNDVIDDLAAQEALPSAETSTRPFRIFQCRRYHQAVTTKTVHGVILSENECDMNTLALDRYSLREAPAATRRTHTPDSIFIRDRCRCTLA